MGFALGLNPGVISHLNQKDLLTEQVTKGIVGVDVRDKDNIGR